MSVAVLCSYLLDFCSAMLSDDMMISEQMLESLLCSPKSWNDNGV